MALKTHPFDAAEYLEDDEAIAEYLEEAMKVAMEDSDPSFLAVALGTVARARGKMRDFPARASTRRLGRMEIRSLELC